MSSDIIALSHARDAEPVQRTLLFVPQRAGIVHVNQEIPVNQETPVNQEIPATIKHPERDAFLLLLLADQELTAGRCEQAKSLIDAAYDAFDGQSG
jgi:hypothetical protein